MSEPDGSAASTTSTPRARPLIKRLRRGKFFSRGGVPGGNSDRSPPSRGNPRAQARDGAPDTRDRGRCRRPRASIPRRASAPSCAARVDAERETRDDRQPGVGQRAREAARVVAAPARVALRLPTIASAGRFSSSRAADEIKHGRRDSRARAAPADSRHRPTPRARGRAARATPCVRASASLRRRRDERCATTRVGNDARTNCARDAARTASGLAERAQQRDHRRVRQRPQRQGRPGLAVRGVA